MKLYQNETLSFVLLIALTMLFQFVFSPCLFASSTDKNANLNLQILDDTVGNTVIQSEIEDFSSEAILLNGDTYYAISLAGESNKKELGAPALPDISRSIIIPESENVEIKVLDSVYYDINDFDIIPSKGYLSREVDPAEIPYILGDIYDLDAFYPAELAQLSEPYILRDFRGVVFTINPIQYNPVQHTLRVFTSITVAVSAVTTSQSYGLMATKEESMPSKAFDRIYRAHFINYPRETKAVIRQDQSAVLEEYGELLIIAPDNWLSNLQRLKDHKEKRGVPTTIVALSDIAAAPSAMEVKAYIQKVYDDPDRDLAYVMLVGDFAQVNSFTAVTGRNGESDAKYAKLAGDDDYPDVIVGRLSAESTDDVDTQVERIIFYETMDVRSQEWFWRGVGIGSDDGWGNGDDGEYDWEHLRNIRSDLIEYGYTLVDELYEGTQSGQDAAGDPPASLLSAAVNKGRGVINYCGHGSIKAWRTTRFSNTDVDALTNDHMLPFIFSVACQNGNFGESTCFAESWMRATNQGIPAGAIGVYASSINQPWSPPMEAQDAFNALYTSDSYISYGAYCYAAACSMMDAYPGDGEQYGNGHATFNTWILFGDPSLLITYDNQPPVAQAGNDKKVERNSYDGAVITLDGSGSYDPDGDELTYAWQWEDGFFVYGEKADVTIPPSGAMVSLTVSDGQFYDTDTVSIEVVDTTPPELFVVLPDEDGTVQGDALLIAKAMDYSGVSTVFYYLKEWSEGDDATTICDERLPATKNSLNENWEYMFDSTTLEDGYYVVFACGVDTIGNEGCGPAIPFTISNWTLQAWLPPAKRYMPGRTIPIKFSLNVAEAVDPEMPFVYHEGLQVNIYDTANPDRILQTSIFGSCMNNYRIDEAAGHYITTFKTSKKPASYIVDVRRAGSEYLIGSFSFSTKGSLYGLENCSDFIDRFVPLQRSPGQLICDNQ